MDRQSNLYTEVTSSRKTHLFQKVLVDKKKRINKFNSKVILKASLNSWSILINSFGIFVTFKSWYCEICPIRKSRKTAKVTYGIWSTKCNQRFPFSQDKTWSGNSFNDNNSVLIKFCLYGVFYISRPVQKRGRMHSGLAE